MAVEIIDCEQGTPQWLASRLGIPTASKFSVVMAKGEGKTRTKYLYQLAGEIVTGDPHDGYSNTHMERGHAHEDEARRLYGFMQDVDIQQVGFIRNGPKGCSPDGLIGDDGMAEFKSKLPDILIDLLLRDRLPPEHKAQCQGGLWVAEREWIDFSAYWPKLPLFTVRVYRDEEYIKTLADEVERFNDDLAGVVERVRAYGAEPAREAA